MFLHFLCSATNFHDTNMRTWLENMGNENGGLEKQEAKGKSINISR